MIFGSRRSTSPRDAETPAGGSPTGTGARKPRLTNRPAADANPPVPARLPPSTVDLASQGGTAPGWPFTLTSTGTSRDGDYLGQDHVMGADFGIPLRRREHLAGPGLGPTPPAGTKSFASPASIPMRRPAAGSGIGWSSNLPADCRELPRGAGFDHARGDARRARCRPARTPASRVSPAPARRRATIRTAISSPCMPSTRGGAGLTAETHAGRVVALQPALRDTGKGRR